jgi:hypothetical protein
VIYLLLAFAAADAASHQPVGLGEMKWFDRPSNAAALIGTWRVDPNDAATLNAFGDVEMEFDDRGNLRYVLKGRETDQIILMTYKVQGDLILSDQPSHPNPQRSKYVLGKDGSLTIYFDGQAARFIRP